ncbi:MAG: cation:proton antiporter [Nitrosopumilaceae archaeon]|nr:cation:proton antiporter [Nitrosopumilaceae archaeon]NIU00913.1 cation:proton antiporter [Nitrosopumilaceae archaeon]NIU87366.1 cation:proton antiporter [Nitrosopumilaceae archaeon]NIV65894.1 cation:proton antiporter [Nitrosopumilaceae archaeon]NIX61515.1 cation:proton antiporter [Nitrosopumilaceae archaeon]
MVVEFDVIPTIVGILVVVIPAMLMGKLCSKFGISEIIGFVIAGIIFGPHAIGGLIPFGERSIVMTDELMLSFWQISGIIVLFSAGLHFTFGDLKKAGIKAVVVGVGGVVLPLVFGYIISMSFGFDWIASVILGATLSTTSIAVSVTVLEEINKSKTKEGNVLVNAAVLDDVLGLAILSAVVSIIVAEEVPSFGSILFQTGEAIGFWFLLLLGSVFVLPKIVHLAVSAHPATLESRGTNQAVAIGSAFGIAAIAGSLGLNPIVGSFAAGMGLADSKFVNQVREFVGRLKIMFAPLFFAILGAHIDITKVYYIDFLLFISLILIAVISKIVGSGLPAITLLKSERKGIRVGYGMIARGEIAFITAGIGLAHGIIDNTVFSTLIFVILSTIIISPILLRYSYRTKNWFK